MALSIDETFNYRFDTITLKPGELIFNYTDGVTEAFDANGDMYSAERLQKGMAACNFDLSRELVLHILERVTSFSTDVPQTDDITIMAIRFGPGRADVHGSGSP